jgi:hypothetical protein
MPHGGLGTLAPSQQPTPGIWVERGAIADAAVRRLWLRSFENVQTTAAGLTTTTALQGSGGLVAGAGCGVAAARFTRSSDSLVMTVAADDIIAVSAT